MTTTRYRTTDRAGYFLNGRRLPTRMGEDGTVQTVVGHELVLSEAEAKYPLMNGEIEPVDPAPTPVGRRPRDEPRA